VLSHSEEEEAKQVQDSEQDRLAEEQAHEEVKGGAIECPQISHLQDLRCSTGSTSHSTN
jgi:hypothetical protein